MLASHKLNVIPLAKPMRQKVRRFYPDSHRIIQTEVDNILRVGFIRKVKYLEWLANVVVVPKKGGMESMRGLHRPQRSMSER